MTPHRSARCCSPRSATTTARRRRGPAARHRPDIGNTEVADPIAGNWTATSAGPTAVAPAGAAERAGTYTGNLSFREMAQTTYVRLAAPAPVTIPADSSRRRTCRSPSAANARRSPGMSVQFVGQLRGDALAADRTTHARRSRRRAGRSPPMTGTRRPRCRRRSRTFNVDVAAGETDLTVTFQTADASPDNPYDLLPRRPVQQVVAEATPTTTLQGIRSTTPREGEPVVPNPVAGRWEIVIDLGLTTCGNEFSQTINGDVTFDNSGVTVLSGLPTATTTTLAQGTPQTVQIQMTNTTGVGRTSRSLRAWVTSPRSAPTSRRA